MKRLLIAGCGDVGTELARLLMPQWRVWGIRRTAHQLPEGIEPIAADLAEPLPPLPEVDQVVYCAAAGRFDEATYRRAYVTGLENLIEALPARHRIQRFIFTSSTGVYHQINGEWVDENSPTKPTSFSGKILVEAEQILLASGLPTTSVRLGGIYGPGRDRLIRTAYEGESYPSEPPLYSNRIHRDDCAGVIAHLMGLPEIHDTYVATDCSPSPLHEVIQWMRGTLLELGLQPQQDGLAPSARGPLRASKRCSSKRLQETGYPFRFPDYTSGYLPLLQAWVKERKGQKAP